MQVSWHQKIKPIIGMAVCGLLINSCSSYKSSHVKFSEINPARLTTEGRYVLTGDVTSTSARINLTTTSAGDHSVAVLHGLGSNKAEHISITTTFLDGAHYARGNYDLKNLTPDSQYILMGQQGKLGEFKTLAEDPEVVRLMFGSCFNYADDSVQIFPDFNKDEGRYEVENHLVWKVVNDQEFDGAFFIGDRFYLPNYYEDYDGMTDAGFYQLIDEHHEGMMGIPGMQKFLTRTPLYVTWDDHDLGPNNSAGDFVYKGQALKHTAWSLPQPNMGTEETPGIFFKLDYGDMEVFVLDGRYYRECSNRTISRRGNDLHYCGVDGVDEDGDGVFHPDEMLKDCYGEEQLNWLKEELLASDATAKIIVGGNQFLSNIHKWEAWYHYEERQEFLNWLNENPVPGVVFVSGDRHHGEIGVLDQDVPYPLYELTASGMGTNCYLSDEINDPDPTRSPFDVLGGSENHFGVVEYHKADQKLHLQLYDYKGEKVTDEMIKLATLNP